MAPGFSLTPSDHLLCALYGNPVNYFILVAACFAASSMLYYGIKSTRYDHQTMLKASASVSDHSGVVREVGDVLFATGIGDEIYPTALSTVWSGLTPWPPPTRREPDCLLPVSTNDHLPRSSSHWRSLLFTYSRLVHTRESRRSPKKCREASYVPVPLLYQSENDKSGAYYMTRETLWLGEESNGVSV